MVAGGCGGGEGQDGSQRARRKFGEVMDEFTVLVGMMASQGYTYVKT